MVVTAKSSFELSEQQIECLQRLADGQTLDEIAHAMSLSELTISLLLSNASCRLGASSTSNAVVISIKENLINA